MTPKVTVVIPTHNRPAMLRDALASVCVQTWPEWEALVIDDGSEPAVDAAGLVAEFGSRIRVVRNRQSMKLAYVRDQGVQLAAGAYVTQLDDDDRLAPTALAEAMAIFTGHVDLEVLFLGVLGFGVNRENFDLNQQATLNGVLTRASAVSHEGLIHFDRELFSALLGAVPMPFQRAMMPCAVWHRVSALRLQAYQLDPTVTDQEAARQLIQPPLRDSEWALYAAVSSRAALLDRPLYLQRCEGQGYVSLPAQRERATLASIDIKRHLLRAAQKLDIFKPWQHEIRASLARAYFDLAYLRFQTGHRRRAYVALAQAFAVRPSAACLRFGVRMLLPI